MFGFEDVIGQEVLKRQLKLGVEEGRIPHAQLFCGPSGVGKMSLLLAYARLLTTAFHPSDTADKQWEKLMHPDVHFMFPIISSEKKKKTVCADYLPQWRQLLCTSTYFSYAGWLEAMEAENGQAIIYAKESDEISRVLSLKSVESEYKVAIVWLPEKMHETCANKMLKLLEEPPEKTVFLLASEEPEKILPTILSRTQRINVPRLSEEDIAGALTQRYGVDAEQSKHIAHMANGSFVKALDTIHYSEESERMLDFFANLMRLAYARKIREMKGWSEQVAALGREQQKNLLAYSQRMIRESFIANFRLSQMNYMTRAEQQFTSRFSPFINEKNATAIMEELAEAQLHIEQNVNAKMVFFDLSLKMITLLIQK